MSKKTFQLTFNDGQIKTGIYYSTINIEHSSSDEHIQDIFCRRYIQLKDGTYLNPKYIITALELMR